MRKPVGRVKPANPRQPQSPPLPRVGRPHAPHAPINRIHPPRHTPAKRRIRPVRRMRNQSVLNRIEMNVVHMRGIIPIVAHRMFPKAALPDTRSPLRTRTAERRSVCGIAAANSVFTACHRPEKSASPGGSVQMQCRCSGNTTHASMWKGARPRAVRTTSRRTPISSTSNRLLRSSRFTVKKYVPPGTRFRR